MDLYDEIRLPAPRRGRGGAYVAIIGVTAGIVALVLAVTVCERLGFFTASESPPNRALTGQPVAVEARAGVDQVVYSDNSSTSDLRCTVTGHTEVPVTFRPVVAPFALSAPDGTWYGALWMQVESSGSYEIQCTGATGGYGVGPDGRLTSFVDQRVFLFAVPGGAVACGIGATVLVWWLRRRKA